MKEARREGLSEQITVQVKRGGKGGGGRRDSYDFDVLKGEMKRRLLPSHSPPLPPPPPLPARRQAAPEAASHSAGFEAWLRARGDKGDEAGTKMGGRRIGGGAALRDRYAVGRNLGKEGGPALAAHLFFLSSFPPCAPLPACMRYRARSLFPPPPPPLAPRALLHPSHGSHAAALWSPVCPPHHWR